MGYQNSKSQASNHKQTTRSNTPNDKRLRPTEVLAVVWLIGV
jgi:hypothetical protein